MDERLGSKCESTLVHYHEENEENHPRTSDKIGLGFDFDFLSSQLPSYRLLESVPWYGWRSLMWIRWTKVEIELKTIRDSLLKDAFLESHPSDPGTTDTLKEAVDYSHRQSRVSFPAGYWTGTRREEWKTRRGSTRGAEGE